MVLALECNGDRNKIFTRLSSVGREKPPRGIEDIPRDCYVERRVLKRAKRLYDWKLYVRSMPATCHEDDLMIMKYFGLYFSKHENGDAKYSAEEVKTIETSLKKFDGFLNILLEVLEKTADGSGFTKRRFKPMDVLFEKREIDRGDAEVDTLNKPYYCKPLKRKFNEGISIVRFPYKTKPTPRAVFHELAHVVYNSFTKSRGVNRHLKRHLSEVENAIDSQTGDRRDFEKPLKEWYGDEKVKKELFAYKLGNLVASLPDHLINEETKPLD